MFFFCISLEALVAQIFSFVIHQRCNIITDHYDFCDQMLHAGCLTGNIDIMPEKY